MFGNLNASEYILNLFGFIGFVLITFFLFLFHQENNSVPSLSAQFERFTPAKSSITAKLLEARDLTYISCQIPNF